MGKYKPRYDDLSKVSDIPTLTGKTSRNLVEIEESSQRAVAESPEWLLARKTNSVHGKAGRYDSKPELERLGFKVLDGPDDLFYSVKAPEGWDKSTKGLWTTVIDSKGEERIIQFFKGALYDREAFLNIK